MEEDTTASKIESGENPEPEQHWKRARLPGFLNTLALTLLSFVFWLVSIPGVVGFFDLAREWAISGFFCCLLLILICCMKFLTQYEKVRSPELVFVEVCATLGALLFGGVIVARFWSEFDVEALILDVEALILFVFFYGIPILGFAFLIASRLLLANPRWQLEASDERPAKAIDARFRDAGIGLGLAFLLVIYLVVLLFQ